MHAAPPGIWRVGWVSPNRQVNSPSLPQSFLGGCRVSPCRGVMFTHPDTRLCTLSYIATAKSACKTIRNQV